MKIRRLLILACFGLSASFAGFGQTPPNNDNFTNRTVLTGTDLIFSGTLARATLENYKEAVTYNIYMPPDATASVWWSWTAPATTVMNLQIIQASLTQNSYTDGLLVYQANGTPCLTNLTLVKLGSALANVRLSPISVTLPVIAGTEYEIQLIGKSSANYTFRLIATNTPVILQQPQNQTVYSNASTVLYAVTAGYPHLAFTYQWLFGTNVLPGETSPMLALTNIDSSKAGAYSVVVSNAAGYTVSQPAIITVSQSNIPISLALISAPSNTLSFSMTGESGRNYRIESSTDLVHWAAEPSFPKNPLWPNTTSIVHLTNSTQVFMVTNNAARKFFRARPYVHALQDEEICVNNLQQIRISKLFWQRDYPEIYINNNLYNTFFVSSSMTPRVHDLQPYFPRGILPVCPDDPNQIFGISYTVDSLLPDPVCDIFPATHLLEQPE